MEATLKLIQSKLSASPIQSTSPWLSVAPPAEAALVAEGLRRVRHRSGHSASPALCRWRGRKGWGCYLGKALAGVWGCASQGRTLHRCGLLRRWPAGMSEQPGRTSSIVLPPPEPFIPKRGQSFRPRTDPAQAAERFRALPERREDVATSRPVALRLKATLSPSGP